MSFLFIGMGNSVSIAIIAVDLRIGMMELVTMVGIAVLDSAGHSMISSTPSVHSFTYLSI